MRFKKGAPTKPGRYLAVLRNIRKNMVFLSEIKASSDENGLFWGFTEHGTGGIYCGSGNLECLSHTPASIPDEQLRQLGFRREDEFNH